jgi:phosphonate transport system permease protein
VSDGLRELSTRFVAAGVDASLLALAWILTTYVLSWVLWRQVEYIGLHWGWLLTFVVVGTWTWEAFGHSTGQRLIGRELLSEDWTDPGIRARFLRFLAVPVSVVSLVGMGLQPPLHERVAHVVLARRRPSVGAPRPWIQTSSGLLVAYVLTAMLVASLTVPVTPAGWRALFTQAGRTVKIWRAFFDPELSVFGPSCKDLIVTVYMAIMATAFAVVVSVPLSFLAARNLTRGPGSRAVYTVLRGMLSVIRSIEPIVWAIVFLVWVEPRRAAFAGTLALWAHSIADLTKLYAERIEAIDAGPLEAVEASGASRLSVIRHAVVPQIVTPYISFTLYRWDINIRMSMIVGAVGGGGIGARLFEYVRGLQWREASMVMLLIIVLVWAADYLSGRLRERLA